MVPINPFHYLAMLVVKVFESGLGGTLMNFR
jgi:hypothetical protein